MKINQALAIYLLLVVKSFTGYVMAQTASMKQFDYGYLYTTTDTLKVYIRQQANFDYDIVYKTNPEAIDFLTINSREVISIKVLNKQFNRIEFRGKSFLAEVLEEGLITLYKHNEVSYSTHHVYNKEAGAFLPTKGYSATVKFYLSKNSEVHELGDIFEYKRNLKRLMNDQQQIIALIKHLRFHHIEYTLDKLVRHYNQRRQSAIDIVA